MIEMARSVLETHYSSGDVLDVRELHGGFVNRTFSASSLKDGKKQKLVVRAYNAHVAESDIRFEHALIRHLKQQGFHLVADVIPCKNGDSYIWKENPAESSPSSTLWAVFEFLEGEDRYTWTDTNIAADDMASAAGVLADLHQASRRFVRPPGSGRSRPGIMKFLSAFGESCATYTKQAADTRFDRRFVQERDNILKAAAWAVIPEADRQEFPVFAIHCDFHQGNLKYRGSEAVGVFDFDWSRIDMRLFDVALALFYFCGEWGVSDTTRHSLNPEKLTLFLETYCRRCREWPDLEPLSPLEKKYLPAMLAAANLFVLHWTIHDYYAISEPDQEAYRNYLEHGISILGWIPKQADLIESIAAQAAG